MKKLVRNDAMFDKMFLEGLEQTATTKFEEQDNFINRKQTIFVNGHQFEFT